MATGSEIQQTFAEVRRDPESAVSTLPTLVSLLDHDDVVVRVNAAWGICLVVAARPGVAERVREAVRSTADSDEAVLVGQWLRTGAPSPPEDAEQPPDPFVSEEETPDFDTASGTTDNRQTNRPASEADPPPDPNAVIDDGRFTVPLAQTRLDRLEIVECVEATDYRQTHVGLATIDGDESAVWVRSYGVPDGVVEETFRDVVGQALDAWRRIAASDHVLNVYAVGRRPQPWAVIDHAARSLRNASQPSVEEALRAGRDGARGLAHAHEHGVVHGTVDLRSFAFTSVDDGRVVAVDGVGVGDAFRSAEGPVPLDPRFSAPEQFDPSFGRIDRQTDVFQAGAVLYTLLTGVPPRDVRPDETAEGPGLEPPTPSAAVDAVPPAADEVVETAMAPRKLARYESADAMAAALTRLLDGEQTTRANQSGGRQ